MSTYELCTVDVWDTLLRRRCHPDAVKLHTAGELLALDWYGVAPRLRSPRALLDLRLQVEVRQARAARANGFDDEFTLDEVLKEWLARALQRVTPARRRETARRLREHEVRHERFVSYADPRIERFLRRFDARQWRFLSDFYLPAGCIGELLDDKQLSGRFDGGLVSCELLLSKRSGRLFEEAGRRWRVDPSRHLHLGDSPLADVRVPRRLGITARRYWNAREERSRRERTRWFSRRKILFRALANACGEQARGGRSLEARGHRLGLELAPLVAGFALFVLERARREGVSQVFFCAREGELFAKAYERLVAAYPHDRAVLPVAVPLEVSRQATYPATLEPPTMEKLKRLWAAYPRQSMRTWALSLQLPPERVQAWCRRLGVSFEEEIQEPWRDAAVRKMVADHEVQSELAAHASRLRERLAAYLRQAGLPGKGRVGLVDIGWRGSIQDNLATLYPSIQWNGYYLGLQGFLSRQPGNSRKAAFGPDLNRQARGARFFSDLPLLEMLFNSPGGSVMGYEQLPDGRVHVQRLADSREDETLDGVVRHIQEGMLAGVSIWGRAMHEQAVSSDELRDFALGQWSRLLKSPPRFLKTALLNAHHNELFGRGRFDVKPPRSSPVARLLSRVRKGGPAGAAEGLSAKGRVRKGRDTH